MVKRPRVRTIFPHTAGNNGTLISFEEGDVITLLIPEERDGWMYGELENSGKWVESHVWHSYKWCVICRSVLTIHVWCTHNKYLQLPSIPRNIRCKWFRFLPQSPSLHRGAVVDNLRRPPDEVGLRWPEGPSSDCYADHVPASPDLERSLMGGNQSEARPEAGMSVSGTAGEAQGEVKSTTCSPTQTSTNQAPSSRGSDAWFYLNWHLIWHLGCVFFLFYYCSLWWGLRGITGEM